MPQRINRQNSLKVKHLFRPAAEYSAWMSNTFGPDADTLTNKELITPLTCVTQSLLIYRINRSRGVTVFFSILQNFTQTFRESIAGECFLDPTCNNST